MEVVTKNMAYRPTIKDIARLSESSIATVSRVLNNTDYPVTEELRERILKVAQEINYKPNIYGKMLKGGQSREIGLLIPNISNPFYAELVSGVERVCIKNDYTPIICSSYNMKKLEKKHLDMLIMKQVDGILGSFIGDTKKEIQELNADNMRYVLFDQTPDDKNAYNISFDFFQSGYKAAEFLLQNDHHNIAFLSAPFDRKSRTKIYNGFLKAHEEFNLMFDEKNLIIHEMPEADLERNAEIQNGALLVRKMLDTIGLPDAIVAINDITALGIIQELYACKYSIPEDVSLISFDDIPLAGMVTPRLTTMRQPAFEIGKEAAKMLINQIEGQFIETKSILIKPELIERDTVQMKGEKNEKT